MRKEGYEGMRSGEDLGGEGRQEKPSKKKRKFEEENRGIEHGRQEKRIKGPLT